jgi:hypothetical protein
MKSSIALLGLSTLLASEVYAQKNAPDALNWENPEKVRKQYRLADSTFKGLRGNIDLDSLIKDGNEYLKQWDDSKAKAKGFAPGVLLDQGVSEFDGYIQGGQKYYIRNFKPLIEPKEVSPGIYHCK